MKGFYPKTGAVAVLLLSFYLTGCTQVRDIVGKYDSTPTETEKIVSESEYTYLDDEAEILELLLSTMKNNKSSCSFNIEEKDLVDTELWMAKLGGIKSVSVESAKVQNGFNVYVSLEYWDNYPIIAAHEKNDTTGLTAKQAELLEKYYQILSECITADMDNYQKELAIHDYLVSHIEYDTTMSGEYAHTAYGALMLGYAVCDGYAESFQTLMDLMGIESMVISGEGKDNPHMWNLVSFDGAWYHVDVTWDDPVGGLDIISHEYFNVSDSEMEQEHEWDRTKYPAAVGTKYSYYLMGDIQQIYTQQEFNDYITQCISEGYETIEAVIHTEVSLEEALKAAGVSLSYSYNIIDRALFKVYEITITYK